LIVRIISSFETLMCSSACKNLFVFCCISVEQRVTTACVTGLIDALYPDRQTMELQVTWISWRTHIHDLIVISMQFASCYGKCLCHNLTLQSPFFGRKTWF
jgi:hypothetical protein